MKTGLKCYSTLNVIWLITNRNIPTKCLYFHVDETELTTMYYGVWGNHFYHSEQIKGKKLWPGNTWCTVTGSRLKTKRSSSRSGKQKPRSKGRRSLSTTPNTLRTLMRPISNRERSNTAEKEQPWQDTHSFICSSIHSIIYSHMLLSIFAFLLFFHFLAFIQFCIFYCPDFLFLS